MRSRNEQIFKGCKLFKNEKVEVSTKCRNIQALKIVQKPKINTKLKKNFNIRNHSK